MLWDIGCWWWGKIDYWSFQGLLPNNHCIIIIIIIVIIVLIIITILSSWPSSSSNMHLISAGFFSRHSNLKFWSQPIWSNRFLSVMWWCYAIASCDKVLKPIISGVDLQWAVSSEQCSEMDIAADLASILHPPALTPPSSTPLSDFSWLWQSIWMCQQGFGFYSSYKPANNFVFTAWVVLSCINHVVLSWSNCCGPVAWCQRS